MNVCVALVEWLWRENLSARRKTCLIATLYTTNPTRRLLPLCIPQIPRGLDWNRTLPSAMRRRRQTCHGMAWPSRWPVLIRKPVIFLGISWQILYWDKTFTSRSPSWLSPRHSAMQMERTLHNQNSRIVPHSVRSAQLIPIACVTSYEHQDACNNISCAPLLNAYRLHHKTGRILTIGHQNICFLGVAFDSCSLQFS